MKRRIYFIIFIIVANLSCNKIQVESANAQIEKYYQFYESGRYDSIINLISPELLNSGDDSIAFLKSIKDHYNACGKVVSKQSVLVSQTDGFMGAQFKHQIDITFKVEYNAGKICKEKFSFTYDSSVIKRLSSIELTKWTEKE